MRDDQLHSVQHRVPGAEVFIQHVSSNDFYVHSFSAFQIKILQQLLASGQPITIHCDATGSIIKAPDGVIKRIYYYVLSVALPILDEKRKVLFPLLEMISAAHDSFTISTWLGKFKDEFIRQVGSWTAPDHFVTDFSFAILNAASSAFNNEDLIDQVNRTYDEFLNPHTDAETTDATDDAQKKKKTAEHICCNHFSKTSAQDVDIHFPPSVSSTTVRSFLKETLAMMFNMSELELLSTVYINLSIILNSKYLTGEVTAAINSITSMVKTLKVIEEIPVESENEENFEILQFDEPENDAIYRKSKFYKMFKRLTITPNYDNTTQKLNNFYCPVYCDLLLSKYIAILPLWTCLTCPERKSNSNSESLFNIIKTEVRENAATIGRVPLRSSRFLRFTRKLINEWANEFWNQLPRTNTCHKKRPRSVSNSPQASKRRRIEPSTPSFATPKRSASATPKSSQPLRVRQLSQSNNDEPLRKSPRRTSATPKRYANVTPKSSRLRMIQPSQSNVNESANPLKLSTTPTSSSSQFIGDPNATESWGPKRRKAKPKHSYFQFNLLKRLDSPEVIKQIFEVKDNRVINAAKLSNNLIDDPNVYFRPNSAFVVACVDKFILSNTDYRSLLPNRQITRDCINFYLNVLPKRENRKDTQFIFFDTCELISENSKVPKIQHDNIILILNQRGVYSLVIINLKKKVTAYIDLKIQYPTSQMQQNVLKFLKKHNETYNTAYELQGWNDIKMKFPTLEYGNDDDSGVYILRFIHDLILHNTISSKEFDVDQHRLTIAHYILNKSAKMTDLCLICGRKDDEDTRNPFVDWMECERCKRWCHKICLQTTNFNVAFTCILCV